MQDDFLTEAEKGLLISFNENVEMKEVVKKVLLRGIYDNGVVKKGKKHDSTRNWALSLALNQGVTMSNEAVGAKLVALSEGIRFLESAFGKIGEYVKVEKQTPKINKAI